MSSTLLPEKDPRESVVVAFDFSDEATALVGTPQVSCVVFAGNTTDATPGAMVSGSATPSGTQVLQRIQGGKSGNSYGLSCVATNSNGDTLVRAAVLPVLTQPN